MDDPVQTFRSIMLLQIVNGYGSMAQQNLLRSEVVFCCNDIEKSPALNSVKIEMKKQITSNPIQSHCRTSCKLIHIEERDAKLAQKEGEEEEELRMTMGRETKLFKIQTQAFILTRKRAREALMLGSPLALLNI